MLSDSYGILPIIQGLDGLTENVLCAAVPESRNRSGRQLFCILQYPRSPFSYSRECMHRIQNIHDYNLEYYKPLSTWSPSEVIFKD